MEPGWGLLLGPDSRDLRRGLRAVEWIVLEDVALDAVLDNGRAVAATSARRVATNLAIDPGRASSALRRLRSLGLVEHHGADGTAGRFGLSVYVLGPTPGIELVPATHPCRAESGTAGPRAANEGTESTGGSPRMERPQVHDAPVDAPRRPSRR